MTTTVLRKELHTMIDIMPDQFVRAMAPLVTCIAEEYWKPAIEPADEEESAMIDEAVARYKSDPSSFHDWDDVKKEMGF